MRPTERTHEICSQAIQKTKVWPKVRALVAKCNSQTRIERRKPPRTLTMSSVSNCEGIRVLVDVALGPGCTLRNYSMHFAVPTLAQSAAVAIKKVLVDYKVLQSTDSRATARGQTKSATMWCAPRVMSSYIVVWSAEPLCPGNYPPWSMKAGIVCLPRLSDPGVKSGSRVLRCGMILPSSSMLRICYTGTADLAVRACIRNRWFSQ